MKRRTMPKRAPEASNLSTTQRGRVLSLLLLALGVLVPGVASAQTLTLNSTNYERTPEVTRESPELVKAIALSDCEADGSYVLSVSRSGVAASTLRVFVSTGADCAVKENRTRDKGCIEISSQADTAANYSLEVYFRDIIAAHRTGSAKCAAFDEACRSSACTDIDSGTRKTLTLYFILDDSSDTAVSSVTWETSYDLAGPNAPSGVGIGIGEEQLTVKWKASAATDLSAYKFYCDPRRGATGGGGTSGAAAGGTAGVATGGAAGAATGGAGGAPATGGTGGDAACTSSVLFPTEVPPTAYQCGSTSSKTATSGIVSGLTNFQTYTIGVAAVDDLGNPGPLSELVCAVPEPVDDFFEVYRRNGGKGGNGYCSFNQAPAPSAGVLLGVAMLGLLLRRRRLR